MLQQRLITAAIIIPPSIVVLWVGGWLMTIFCLSVMAVAAYEYFSFSKIGSWQLSMQACLCTMLPSFATVFYGANGALVGFVLGFVLLMALLIASIERSAHQPDFAFSVPSALFGFSYLGVLGVPLTLVCLNEQGNSLLAWVIAVVACTDSGAFFGGKLLGKTKMSPRISPNKTREGALCGLISAGLAAWLAGSFLLPEHSPVTVLFVGMGAGALAEIGDLVESLAKRIHDVKDSGTILPGHGGFLDRVDGIIFGIPLVFCL